MFLGSNTKHRFCNKAVNNRGRGEIKCWENIPEFTANNKQKQASKKTLNHTNMRDQTLNYGVMIMITVLMLFMVLLSPNVIVNFHFDKKTGINAM